MEYLNEDSMKNSKKIHLTKKKASKNIVEEPILALATLPTTHEQVEKPINSSFARGRRRVDAKHSQGAIWKPRLYAPSMGEMSHGVYVGEFHRLE